MMTFNYSTIATKILSRSSLLSIKRGIEKEGLRIDGAAVLSNTPHPKELGAAICNPYITTDFCEQQIELVTSVHSSCRSLYEELFALQVYVAKTLKKLGDERIACASMPGVLPPGEQIQLAKYGRSNFGQFKNIYRRGLANRYGKTMQTISGIHYNWSIDGLSDDDYFALMRNFRRYVPLLLLLFGSSPLVDKSYVSGCNRQLVSVSEDTYGLPFATSLRLGGAGYQSDSQNEKHIPFNNLEDFCTRLESILLTPYPEYGKIGLRSRDGDYLQLNTCLLQLENEHYSPIRVKQLTLPNERVLHGLRTRGVRYVEVRILDINPFYSAGISCSEIELLDAFLVFALCKESPLETEREVGQSMKNLRLVAEGGRNPELVLELDGKKKNIKEWSLQVLAEIEEVAKNMDQQLGCDRYQTAIEKQRHLLADFGRLPSQQVVTAVKEHFNGSWRDFLAAQSQKIYDEFCATNQGDAMREKFKQASELSCIDANRMENEKEESFDAYLQATLDAKKLRV